MSPGSDGKWQWCYNPPFGTTSTTVSVLATDNCGASTQRSWTATFIRPQAPACALPPNTTYKICQAGQVCLPYQTGNPLGVTCELIDGPGSLSNGSWCLNVTNDRTVTIRVRCSNACGQVCDQTRTYMFLIRPSDCGGPASVGLGGTGNVAAVPGDVDGSGEANIADLARLRLTVRNLRTKATGAAMTVDAASAGYSARADVNCDGAIDYGDISTLLAYLFDAGPEPCTNE